MNRILTAMVAVAGAAAVASAGSTEIQRFAGFNSPNGNDNPQAYGLRLDNFVQSGAVTFSFEDPTEPTPRAGTSSVEIILSQDTSNASTYYLQIVGTIFGDTSGTSGPQSSPGDIGQYALDITYTGTWDGDLFESTQSTGTDIGSMTLVNGASGVPARVDFQAKSSDDYAFRFGVEIGDRDRDPYDRWIEATGWLMAESFDALGNSLGVVPASQAHDLLFTADPSLGRPVPLPHPASLAGAGLVGLIATRRRR